LRNAQNNVDEESLFQGKMVQQLSVENDFQAQLIQKLQMQVDLLKEELSLLSK